MLELRSRDLGGLRADFVRKADTGSAESLGLLSVLHDRITSQQQLFCCQCSCRNALVVPHTLQQF